MEWFARVTTHYPVERRYIATTILGPYSSVAAARHDAARYVRDAEWYVTNDGATHVTCEVHDRRGV